MSKEKVKKYRGSRTCGGGTHKNRRGAGSRGGRGMAGARKHHIMRTTKMGLLYGKHGFTSKRTTDRKTVINLWELDAIVEHVEGEANQLNLYDLGIEKVLGKGRITKPITIHTRDISRIARDKIEQAGGTITVA
ncbi:50S ribosomal protein L15 [Methanosarcinales archaeon]|nr:MAG: 50S ribosomal protein L15 [Methanosarcinales archaeon]